MKKPRFFAIAFVLIISGDGWAGEERAADEVPTIEMAEPTTLCERFVSAPEQADCEARVKRLKPDFYAASACRNIFSDEAFAKCLELAAKSPADPRQVVACGAEELSDEDRLKCLRSAAAKTRSPYQRLPASSKPAKKKKKP